MKINRAFSLLEILIAMALGSFISLGLADLYFSYERNYQFQKAMMQATQNGILASNMIETLLSQVGYAGCLSLKNVKITSHIALPGFPFVLRDATTSLLRTNGALRRTTQAITALKILNNTDTKITLSHTPLTNNSLLQLSFMSPDIANVIQLMSSPNYIVINDTPKFAKGDIMMISNCSNADIFAIDDVYIEGTQQIIYTKANLAQYKPGAIVGRWMQLILYVANTERKDNLGNLIPALYWHQLNGDDDELVEGISQFFIKQNAKNVQINLTSTSVDNIHEQSQQWQFVAYV